MSAWTWVIDEAHTDIRRVFEPSCRVWPDSILLVMASTSGGRVDRDKLFPS